MNARKLALLAFYWGLMGVALFFRVWHLGNIPGLNGDESFYGVNALDLLHGKAIAWETPNGNSLNVFYFLPVVALHAIFKPSIVLLRSFAVVSGIAALCLNFVLCRRVFGAKSALVSTLTLAVLPENIVQSRFGWDPCETLFASALVYYLSLLAVHERNRSVAFVVLAVVAAAAGYYVHPSNVFLAIFPVVAVLLRWGKDIAERLRNPSNRGAIVFGALLVVLAIGLCTVSLLPKASTLSSIRAYSSHLFIVSYLRMFTGVSAFRAIADSCRGIRTGAWDVGVWDVTALLPLVAVGAYAVRQFRKWPEVDSADRMVASGWVAQLVAFWAVAGAGALYEGYERYGLCLILPGVVIFTRAVCFVTARYAKFRLPVVLAGSAATCVLLASFYVNYFDFIREHGGAYPHARTAAVDPRYQAASYIADHASRSARVYVVATDIWSTYMPLRYFLADRPNITVIKIADTNGGNDAEYNAANLSGNVWFEGYSKQYVTLSMPKGMTGEVHLIPDYTGKPLIRIIHIVPPQP